MSLHVPARFAGPGIAIPLLAAALVTAVWAMTLERIGYERGEEVREAQSRNAGIALAYAQFASRMLRAGPLDQGAFAAFGDELELGAATEVELIALDGTLLARRSAEGLPDDVFRSALLAAARQAKRGSLVSMSGVPRYVSYRVLADRPALVAVATSVQRTLVAFHARERLYLRNAGIATALIVLFAAGLFALWLQESASEERFRQLAGNIPEAFWMLDAPGGRALYMSAALREISGLPPASPDASWREWRRLVHPDDRLRVEEAYGAARRGSLDVEHRIVRPDGGVRWVRVRGFPVREATGEIFRVVGVIADETERRLAQEKLLHQAHYDTLTDLPNRLVCFDRLAQAIGQARRNERSVAALFLDLDRFKTVNDTLGHAVGDALLREVARRLSGCVRAGDTVARVGGDEFAIILTDLARPEDARSAAQKLIDAVAASMQLESHEVFVSASVGIATFPEDGRDGDTLLRNADAAMLIAKEAGRNTYRFYTSAMNRRAMENLLLETDLRRALERAEFRLHYQPKLHAAGGRVAGLEALLRWHHPHRGLLRPAQFVPLLEDSGLIVQVGEWVVRAACRQLAQWRAQGVRVVPVAVNVVVKQFLHHDLTAVIDEALRETGIPPAWLEIEITETDVMQRPDEVVPMLRRLKGRGIGVAIDDFGTGYSSLAYLKRLPVDALKLDRSFVGGLPNDADDASISRAVIALAHGLGLKVIAEGVQTPAQREFLAKLGCDELQGYLCSAPLPADECARFLESSWAATAASSSSARSGLVSSGKP